uniref:Mitochondrialprocessing peptidase subunit beta puta n=1 Tax=Albugo laibachii Nc14 TaxID=890382 RepID=F0W9P2_9STRA|nr:mitochondrialprocessing peptidase subunit beta puta [Albugo laibachii Nc14]|eukprot:CCA17860.1 mitochondrialprocessing peptidase subunit beta puta [Albugo laibachii Nc14]
MISLKSNSFPSVCKTLCRNKSVAAAVSASPLHPHAETSVTKVSKLQNGVRVASELTAHETATINISINAGTRYANGATALLFERMLLTGTKKRSHEQLEKKIIELGGRLSTHTDRERTVLSAHVHKKDVNAAMQILGEVLQPTGWNSAALTAEAQALAEHIRVTRSGFSKSLVFDHLHQTAFMDSDLGNSLVGKDTDVFKVTLDDLESYHSANITADRVVVAGAGAIDHSELVQLAEKALGMLPAAKTSLDHKPSLFVGSDVRIKNDYIPLAHVAIAFEAFDWTSKHYFPTKLMQVLIGKWDRCGSAGLNASSKLAQAVAEQDLARSFATFNLNYSDTGLFGVYAIADQYKTNDLMWYVMESLVRLVHRTTDEEVESAKSQLKANLLLNLDNTSEISDDIGRQMLAFGKRLSLAETLSQIDAVDAASVRATADEIINDKEHALSAIGSIHELPDYTNLRRRSYWVRY